VSATTSTAVTAVAALGDVAGDLAPDGATDVITNIFSWSLSNNRASNILQENSLFDILPLRLSNSSSKILTGVSSVNMVLNSAVVKLFLPFISLGLARQLVMMMMMTRAVTDESLF
jgi:hypothetical protein